MKHQGLSHSPELLFGRSAHQQCRDFCEEVVDEIRTSPLTPVRTGRMKAGYNTESYHEGARIVNPVDYWIDIELGHDIVDEAGKTVGHQEPRPHVRPAFEIVRSRHQL